MITDWFWTVAGTVIKWLMSLVPDWQVPDNVLHADQAFNDLAASLSGLGIWIPWPVLGGCIGVTFGLWFAVLGWRAFRVLFSHMPFIGGK